MLGIVINKLTLLHCIDCGVDNRERCAVHVKDNLTKSRMSGLRQTLDTAFFDGG